VDALGWRQLVLFHSPDTMWQMPKLNVSVSLNSTAVSASAGFTALTALAAAYLEEVLSEYSYYADCAGLRYNARATWSGISIFFHGYSHKLPLLAHKALLELARMAAGEIDEVVYQRIRDKTLKRYKNFKFQQPYNHCVANATQCLLEPNWSSQEKFIALAESTLADFRAHVRSFSGRQMATVFVHGNATAAEAKTISDSVLNTLRIKPLPLSQCPRQRCVQLEPNTDYIYRTHCSQSNPNEKNSAICNYYSIGQEPCAGALSPAASSSSQLRDEVMLSLLAHIMSEPAFDQLRTKEQLGYIVFTGAAKVRARARAAASLCLWGEHHLCCCGVYKIVSND